MSQDHRRALDLVNIRSSLCGVPLGGRDDPVGPQWEGTASLITLRGMFFTEGQYKWCLQMWPLESAFMCLNPAGIEAFRASVSPWG